LGLILGTLRATTLLGSRWDVLSGIRDLVLWSLGAGGLLGGLSRWSGIPHKRSQEVTIYLLAASVDATITADGVIGPRRAPCTLDDSSGGGLLGMSISVLGLVLGTLRAAALLGFSGRLYLGVLRLILGALGTTPLLGSVIFEREDEILNLDLKSIGATVLGEGVHGDLSDKISDTISDINDVGHSESI
jgi:hypothetical protein